MGSRGASSGRGKATASGGRVSPTAQTFDMNAIETKLRNSGEGTFIRTEVPALVRADDTNGNTGMEIHAEKGYATMVDGVPVFIQGGAGKGYSYNIYGMTASRTPFKTLAEAKNMDNITELVDRVKNAYNNAEQMREIFTAANKEGGITMEEYTRIVRRNRANR